MKRVVITGMGMISPLGAGVAFNWGRLTKGDSGIVPIKSFDTIEFSSKIGGLIPTVGVDNGASCDEAGIYNPAALIPAKTQRKMSDFSVNVVLATEEAIKDAAWYPGSDEQKCRTGVIVGSGLGGFDEMSKGTLAVTAMKNLRRLSPFFLTNALIVFV